MKYEIVAWPPSKKPFSELTEEEREHRRKKTFGLGFEVWRRTPERRLKFVKITGKGLKEPILVHFDELRAIVVAEDAVDGQNTALVKFT